MKKLFALLSLSLSFSLSQLASAGPEPLIGQISMVAGNFAPKGWALCNGQIMSISTHQALFALLGNTYGGDGRTTFALPDLRGRSPIGSGRVEGETIDRGQNVGTAIVTLTAAQMPAHNHTATTWASSSDGTTDSPANGYWAAGANSHYSTLKSVGEDLAANVQLAADVLVVANVGAGQARNNRPPFLGLNYIIALEGLFPLRN